MKNFWIPPADKKLREYKTRRRLPTPLETTLPNGYRPDVMWIPENFSQRCLLSHHHSSRITKALSPSLLRPVCPWVCHNTGSQGALKHVKGVDVFSNVLFSFLVYLILAFQFYTWSFSIHYISFIFRVQVIHENFIAPNLQEVSLRCSEFNVL